MNLYGTSIFEWPIDWMEPANGSWSFNLDEFRIGFGPELTDIDQDHIIHGWEFSAYFQDDDIDSLETFLNSRSSQAILDACAATALQCRCWHSLQPIHNHGARRRTKLGCEPRRLSLVYKVWRTSSGRPNYGRG